MEWFKNVKKESHRSIQSRENELREGKTYRNKTQMGKTSERQKRRYKQLEMKADDVQFEREFERQWVEDEAQSLERKKSSRQWTWGKKRISLNSPQYYSKQARISLLDFSNGFIARVLPTLTQRCVFYLHNWTLNPEPQFTFLVAVHPPCSNLPIAAEGFCPYPFY